MQPLSWNLLARPRCFQEAECSGQGRGRCHSLHTGVIECRLLYLLTALSWRLLTIMLSSWGQFLDRGCIQVTLDLIGPDEKEPGKHRPWAAHNSRRRWPLSLMLPIPKCIIINIILINYIWSMLKNILVETSPFSGFFEEKKVDKHDKCLLINVNTSINFLENKNLFKSYCWIIMYLKTKQKVRFYSMLPR